MKILFKILFRFLYILTFCRIEMFRQLALYRKVYKNNYIVIEQNGKTKKYNALFYKLKGVKIKFTGDNNTAYFKKPFKLKRTKIYFHSSNNILKLDENVEATLDISLYCGNNYVSIGKNSYIGQVVIILHGDKLHIGESCLFSRNITIWTDGHSVIDAETKELLNPPHHTIEIGNHVWVGANATILKKAKIPLNSIVAHSSVVTKIFEQENSVLAGNPAKIVKTGINWNAENPVKYDKHTADFSF